MILLSFIPTYRKNFFYQNLKSAFLAEFTAEESPLLPCLNAEDYGQKHHKRMKILRKSAQSDREMVQNKQSILEREKTTHMDMGKNYTESRRVRTN